VIYGVRIARHRKWSHSAPRVLGPLLTYTHVVWPSTTNFGVVT